MTRRDKALPRQAGFTLIEVMVVVAIVGIGSAIGIPSYLQWNERYQLRQVTSELRSNLLQARMAAKNRNIIVNAAIVKAADNTLTLGFGGALAPMTIPSVVAGGNVMVGGVATDFVISGPGVLGTIGFNQQGLRVAPGLGAQTVTLISPNGTAYTVSVSPSGKIN
ncbi:MAG: prepilin-type N-terminal cleavage/methylation domain-containing protein [Nitrospira sp.]|nr:prepilin-type N-terminal cleavage/methylation domain-containing protein [Nitrospira sp.]TKB73930.1 MAG: prepilin-type N-terminal cleavage/methylation domain-containing protein [Nitrospira sp.]